jgi:hypothetical protein
MDLLINGWTESTGWMDGFMNRRKYLPGYFNELKLAIDI